MRLAKTTDMMMDTTTSLAIDEEIMSTQHRCSITSPRTTTKQISITTTTPTTTTRTDTSVTTIVSSSSIDCENTNNDNSMDRTKFIVSNIPFPSFEMVDRHSIFESSSSTSASMSSISQEDDANDDNCDWNDTTINYDNESISTFGTIVDLDDTFIDELRKEFR